MVFSKGRRIWPEVYNYIEYFAMQYAHQFGLRVVTFLKVQAAQYTAGRFRFVVLYK